MLDGKLVDAQTFFSAFENMTPEQRNTLDLNKRINDGENKGKNLLWQLAGAAAVGYPEFFISFLSKLSDAQWAALDIHAKAEEGEDKGQNVFWLLAKAAASGKPEAFNAFMSKLNDAQWAALDIHAKAEDGHLKGVNIFWLLTFALINYNSEAINFFLSKISDEQWAALDIHAKAEDGPYKGLNIFWLLARAAANGNPKAFTVFLTRLSSSQRAALDIHVKAEDKHRKGENILWLLACASSHGWHEVFTSFLSQLSDAEWAALDIHAQADNKKDKYMNILWVLVKAASLGHPQALNAFLSKLNDEQWARLEIPALTGFEVKEAKDHLEQLEWLNVYAFHQTLRETGANLGEPGKLKQLFALAELAAKDNHSEVYLTLGNHLKEHGDPANAYTAYQQVNPLSKAFTAAQVSIVEMLYSGQLSALGEVTKLTEVEREYNGTTIKINTIDETPEQRGARLLKAFEHIILANAEEADLKRLKANIASSYIYDENTLYDANNNQYKYVHEIMALSDLKDAHILISLKKHCEQEEKIKALEKAHNTQLQAQQNKIEKLYELLSHKEPNTSFLAVSRVQRFRRSQHNLFNSCSHSINNRGTTFLAKKYRTK